MGLSESGHGCKNHPHHHHEKQGVCPSCLRERLSRLCSSGSYEQANSRVSPSFSPANDASASASSSTSAASAARRRSFHKRNGSEVPMGVMGSSTSFMVKFGKSRSMALVPRNFDDDDDDEEEVKSRKMKKKKKKGFWSKLLRFKGKNNKDVLTYSTSMRLIVNLVS